MSSDLIISYDGTPNDDDALVLGKLLAQTGAKPALAYVRHAHDFDPGREQLAQHDADRRLEQGAAWLGQPDVPRHVIVSGATGEGLIELAATEGASTIVFGSDYRTPPGRAEPGNSAQQLLEGAPVAVAVAAAGLRARHIDAIKSIAVFAADGDTAAIQTAEGLAQKLGATITAPTGGEIDLLIVGSAPSGAQGRTYLSGSARSMLNAAQGSVLVVPYGTVVAL
jgi:nucleotide-binding universal stress UspA family protein